MEKTIIDIVGLAGSGIDGTRSQEEVFRQTDDILQGLLAQ